ncbi:MAG: glycoside hydrolase family 2 protein [Bacteroidota bacterium]|nr:glycoside hydrolase family 2 protein [Bacteroidota bacterium]
MRNTLSISIFILLLIIFSPSCKQENSTVIYQQINDNWQFQQVGGDSIWDAEVPGCVHLDLFYNGIIEDPFYRDHETKLQWIENEEWEYNCTFDARQDIMDAEKLELVFEGIDTYADIYLNNELLLHTDNMFRTWVIDCKGQLQLKDNVLKVHFYSPVKMDKEKAARLPYALPDIRGFSRKAPYHYGWDWGPRFVTSGIWRSVSLLAWKHFIIDDVYIQQKELSEDIARLSAQITVESTEDQLVEILIRDKVSGDELVSNEFTLARGSNILNFNFQIDNPILWWPHGWGDPHLYYLECIVKSGAFTDSESLEIGLRTIELIQQEDEQGTSFYFEINTEPLFAKGANYIPQESFLPRLKKEDYLKVIESARAANMNMLRVWGGGVYEDDIFYELCDRNGILVWQDFMFACNMYPGDEGFLQSVQQEVVDNVIRLRNHPCIALWCGNNEVDEGWKNWGWQDQLGYSFEDSSEVWNNYVKLFHELLPDILKKYDISRPYWPSSPSMGWGHGAAFHSGDVHYWGVWWGEEAFKLYEAKVGRFMSEYGFQGMPDLRTIEQYTRYGDREIGSPVMENHQKHPRGTKLINLYMDRDYSVPDLFEDYVYVSQLVQAEGIRKAIEAHRRAKPYCMGTLYWQLNDCWPVTSWSGLDYYGRWKALHYFAKKAYQNVFVTSDMGFMLNFYVLNDSLEGFDATIDITLQDFYGKSYWNHREDLSIIHNSNKLVFTIPKEELLRGYNPGELVLVIKLKSGENILAENIKYFVPVKELHLPVPEIQYAADSISGGSIIGLWTDVLAKNVYLSSSDEKGFFSDNYFDLLPGDTVKIRYSGDLSARDLNDNLKIKSIKDVHEINIVWKNR